VDATKVETAVWEAVSSFLTDPASLPQDLQLMLERRQQTHGDLAVEAKAWGAKLVEAERKREKYQEMFAEEAMTLEELKTKFEVLEETRETAR
jgi:hypothetical protein